MCTKFAQQFLSHLTKGPCSAQMTFYRSAWGWSMRSKGGNVKVWYIDGLSKLVLETLAWLKESMDGSKQRMYADLEIYKFINQLVTAAAYFAIMALPEFHNFSSAGTFHLPFYENFATVICSRRGSLSRYHICGQIVFQVWLSNFEFFIGLSDPSKDRRTPCWGTSRFPTSLIAMYNLKVAVCKVQFAICNMQLAMYNLQFVICKVQFAICNMQLAIYNLQFVICN